jgi:hypothetical protein
MGFEFGLTVRRLPNLVVGLVDHTVKRTPRTALHWPEATMSNGLRPREE